MVDGTSVKIGEHAEVFYQEAGECRDIAEPAIVIQRYAQDDQTFGIIQGDAEIIVGGVENLRRLAKSLIAWAKAEEAR